MSRRERWPSPKAPNTVRDREGGPGGVAPLTPRDEYGNGREVRSAAVLRLLAPPLLAAVATFAGLLLAAVACHAALAAGLARLLTRPFVRGALLVRRLAALAG